jgi:hypothetical protein
LNEINQIQFGGKMKTIIRFKVVSFLLVTTYLLAACGGTLPASMSAAQGPKVQANVVAFTGVVEAISGSEWTVSGQKITLAPQAALDPNIVVGDDVKVEANVSADGAVVALKVEASRNDDVLATPSADASSTPDPVSTSSPEVRSIPEAASTPRAPMAQPGTANQNEVFGTVQALTADTVTVNGVTYSLSNATEFKDAIGAGDQVKLHVIVNADGTLTIREIEKAAASFDDNSSSSNSNGSDDGPNHDANDDHSNGNSSDDSNEDHGGSSGNSGPGSDD